jgi:uncharacterized membrane protein
MNDMKKKEDSVVVEGKVYAILAYLSILCIIPLVLKKDNEFVLSHSKQGLVIFIGQVGFFIASIILGPGFLRLGLFVAGVLSLWGIVAVLQGRYLKMPVVSEIAEKITL